MPPRRRFIPIAVAALALAGCADQRPPAGDTATAVSSPAAAPPSDTPPADVPAADATLALEGEGLRVFLVPSGTARPIPFGRPRGEVVAAVTRILGRDPDVQEGLECGATAARWPEVGLTAWFSGPPAERFVGWSVARAAAPAAVRLTTASGVGHGSTRAALEDAYAASVARTTLGVEFSAGGLAGVLASDAPGATIESLWAGDVCLAR